MEFICPKSPTVWEGNGFSECFENMILGFGANILTIIMIAIFGLKRSSRINMTKRLQLSERILLLFVPAFGLGLSICDMVFLLKKSLQGEITIHHEWFLRCSQFMTWMTVMLALPYKYWFNIFCYRILCFWWIAKFVMEIPHLYTSFSSLEVLLCFKETCSFLVDVIFCVLINVIRVKGTSTKNRKFGTLEDALLSGEDLEEDQIRDSDTNFLCFWNLLTFRFVIPMMDRGVTKQLDYEDLLLLPSELNPSSCHGKLWTCWIAEQSKGCTNASLFRAICSAYGCPYLQLGVLKEGLVFEDSYYYGCLIVNDAIGFMAPLLLNKLIRFLQQGSGNSDGYILALALGLTSTFKSFLDTQYTFHLSKLKLKLRSSIMTVVYQKCLFISLAQRSNFSDGEIQTFMSIDADRTVNLCNSFHDMWSLPLQIGVALYLLYTQVKFAFVSGIAITILLIPVNRWISKLIAKATDEMMKHKDERIRRTGELLTYIRTVKIYSWELLFSSRLMETRALEVKHLSTRKYLDAWCVFFWATTPTLFSLCTFGLFTLLGHPLDAATVFTCVALFNTLISPLNSFPWVINGLIDAMISSRRLSKFLSSEVFDEHVETYDKRLLTAIPSSEWANRHEKDATHEGMAVAIRDADCIWSQCKSDGQNVVLNHIYLDIPKGFFVAVIGEIGSGKSSLINSILGEMQLVHGSICSYGSIGYVPQVPWILSGTIRDNILFGNTYDAKRYKEVLMVCALDVDIDLMVGGDLAYIGEKGSNLSGGQRTRLALARAIYQGSDIYMLDDVLSAVDAQVARWILQNALLGPLMNQKTRVLCTHNIQVKIPSIFKDMEDSSDEALACLHIKSEFQPAYQAISSADMIIVMEKGHVKWTGNLDDFLQCSSTAVPSLKDLEILSSQLFSNGGSISTLNEINPSLSLESDSRADSVAEVKEILEVEQRKEGRVEFSTYKNYAVFASWPVAMAICLSALLMQASRNGNDFWLSHWVDTTAGSPKVQSSTYFFLGVLCIFSAVNSALTLARAFSFALGGLRAAIQVHSKLLNELINAPIQFFEQHPSGRILNRFSSDLYTIDDSLPFILNILLANFFSLLGIAIVLSYAQIFFIFILLPFWYIYSRLQFYYRSTSRELRRLDSVSRSPIYSIFTETLDGSSTIRAFKTEEIFMARFQEHVKLYQQTSYSELTASLWLSLRLQLLAAFIISFIAVMAVTGSHGSFPIRLGTPGLIGLALSYASPIVTLLSSFLSSFTETEKEMVSVERVLQYMCIPHEELQVYQSTEPEWPIHGQIEFKNVTLRYMPSLPPALHDVSFIIVAGMQVGIIGRTGAGKSSVLNALFRLTPICGGWILVDSVDIANVSVRELRSRLAVVPQIPFLFEGTLRDNLDPAKETSDSNIWEALEKCRVKDEVVEAGGLDTEVKEAGISFSVGQRQLLCLARALLKSSKVLCLDECTANVDTQTASRLQNTISRECKGITVITIAHRISTVLNMDNVLILDHGILAEQGDPQVLLQDGSSRFSSFAKASTM